jgi:PDZ domain-containing protein
VSEPTETAPGITEPALPADPEPLPEHEGYFHALTHPSRRGWTLIISAITTLLLLAVAFVLPVPFVKLAPGPTFNVIGVDDGQPVIKISGTPTYPVSGNLDMTTVLESGGPRGGLTFVDAIASWLNPSDAVVPRELLFPDDMTGEEVQKHQALMFSTSESNAIAAALNYLKLPVVERVVVTAVFPDSPADSKLLPKDEVVSIDGTPVTAPEQLGKAVRSAPIGTTFELGVRRDGVEVDGVMKDNVDQMISVTSAANPDDPTLPYIGIGVGTLYSAEFPIDFTLTDVGGPSAGLMFATGIVDKLTPDNLTDGKHIAGTGTIEPDGKVGAIGGIRQKMAGARNAGAELFLMPKVHCAEAADHIPDGLTVVPVETLTDAVTAIQHYNEGTPVATCPAPVS